MQWRLSTQSGRLACLGRRHRRRLRERRLAVTIATPEGSRVLALKQCALLGSRTCMRIGWSHLHEAFKATCQTDNCRVHAASCNSNHQAHSSKAPLVLCGRQWSAIWCPAMSADTPAGKLPPTAGGGRGTAQTSPENWGIGRSRYYECH